MARPVIIIDWGLVEKLAMLQCTQAEIAQVADVAVSTLNSRKNKDRFLKLYRSARDRGKVSLRRFQYAIASDPQAKGHVQMLIWLGKQYLGQKDKSETDSTVEVTDAHEPLGATKEELRIILKETRAEITRRSERQSLN